MLLKFIIRSARGMSLTEIMVAMGLLGGVSIVGMKLMQENAGNDSYIRFKSEVSKAVAMVQSHLSDKNSCKTMLLGKTWGSSHPYLSIVTKDPTNPQMMMILEANKEYDGFLTGDITIEQSKYDSAGSRVTDVVIQFKMRKRNLSSRPAGYTDLIIKRIPVKTELTGSAIRSCGAVLADSNMEAKRQLCEGLIQANAATWDGNDCRLLKVSCPYGQVPFQITSMGAYKCIAVDQKLDPNLLFDFSTDDCSTPGAQVRLVPGVDGKIKAECL